MSVCRIAHRLGALATWNLRLPVAQQIRRIRIQTPAAIDRFLKVSEEVRDAVSTGRPVVALESTIYTHGFPYPENVSLAKSLESIVRRNGAVPATIGIFNGVAKIGLSSEELNKLVSSSYRGQSVLKVSRRDLGYICGLGMHGKALNGGTTVAGTSVLAHLAGIKVFATGGLGGVHRNGENSMDISADLTELGRTPISVVCSGCKSFLDIPRTLEYLETEGVLVGVFADGRTGNIDFPAFYTRDSGIKAPKIIGNEAEAAAMIYTQESLQLSSGIIFANPVPLSYSFPKEEMDQIIARAIELSETKSVTGSDSTPFILSKIKELSGGRSVRANTALVEHNAARGARVAAQLSKLERDGESDSSRSFMSYPLLNTDNLKLPEQNVQPKPEKLDILVAGSLAIDFACDYTPLSRGGTHIPLPGTSNPSIIRQNVGGVGYNLALASSYMGRSVLLCGVVANDSSGQNALSEVQRTKIQPDGIQLLDPSTECRTARYVSVNSARKELVVAMADMSILELSGKELNFDDFYAPLIRQAQPKWTIIDANWNSTVLHKWFTMAKSENSKVAFEPVSIEKSRRMFIKDPATQKAVIEPQNTVPNNSIDLVSPNNLELAEMYDTARESGLLESSSWWDVINALEMPSTGSRDRLIHSTNTALVDRGIPQRAIQLLPFMPCIITTLGSQGVLVTELLPSNDPRLMSPDHLSYIIARAAVPRTGINKVGGVYMRLFPPEQLRKDEIISVNGAGDTLLGVIMAGLASDKMGDGLERLESIIPVAQRASARTLRSTAAVCPNISEHLPELNI